MRFETKNVSFVMLASPPDADMKFRTAGLNDPTIEVPQDATVTVQFINADSDMAHMWVLAPDAPPAGGQQSGGDESTVAVARPLGDPTSAGQPAETITFTAGGVGGYRYYCAFPGHAAQGMHGRFIVQAT